MDSKMHMWLVVSVPMVLLGIGGAAKPAASAVVTSVNSGSWCNPATWSSGSVPSQNDDVTILQFHTVKTGDSGDTVEPCKIKVNSLTIQGDGILENGKTRIQIDATLSVINTGKIRSRDDVGSAAARRIAIRSPSVTNDGEITAGDDDKGGSVEINAGAGNILNHGLIRGGSGSDTAGGDVTLRAGTIENGDAIDAVGQIHGGFGVNGRGGDVSLVATIAVSNYLGSDVTAGTTSSPDSPTTNFRGGHASVQATGTGATAINRGTIQGGGGCPGGVATLAGTIMVNSGTVRAGGCATNCDESPCSTARVDPPNGSIDGDTSISGDVVELFAGESLVIGNLTQADAVSAAMDLTITLAQGGTLDLQNNATGTIRFRAGNSITINADTILLDGGVALSDIMSPAPTVNGGASYTLLYTLPDRELLVDRGETITVEFLIGSAGNSPEDVNYDISDSQGWITPIAGTDIPFSASGSLVVPVTVTVPTVFGSVDEITLTASTVTPGQPVDDIQQTVRLFVVPPVPTVSEWGLAVMTVLILSAGCVLVRKRLAG